jgi:hypothetical protein
LRHVIGASVMTRSGQKRNELARFEVFRKEFHEFPLPPATVDESPDLLVKYNGQVIGLEITELFMPEYRGHERPYGTAALDGIRQRIVRDAQSLYQAETRPLLAVKVWFCTHMKHTKLRPKRSGEIAEALCDLVKEWVVLSMPDGVLTPGARIPEIWRVSVARAVSVPQWERVSPCWLGSLSMEEVQRRIDEKNVFYKAYRENCDRCWLLMVADRYNPAQAFRPTFYQDLHRHSFSYVFDRVFVLEACACHEELIELKKGEA